MKDSFLNSKKLEFKYNYLSKFNNQNIEKITGFFEFKYNYLSKFNQDRKNRLTQAG